VGKIKLLAGNFELRW